MAQYMADILEPEDKAKLHENLLIGFNKVVWTEQPGYGQF